MSHADELANALLYLSTRQLRDFGPPQAGLDKTGLRKTDHSLDFNFAVMSELLHLSLLTRGAVQVPVGEKVNWELEFSCASVPCAIRLAQSGIKLAIWLPEDSGEADTVATDIAAKLGSAVKNIQTQVVEPRIERKRQMNDVRVVNQHGRYAGFVSYFREKLDQALDDREGPKDAAPAGKSAAGGDDLEAALLDLFQPIHGDNEVAYLTTALLAGYFSLVHHRLILLTAFSPAALEPGFSVNALFRDEWANQFASATAGRQSSEDAVAKSDLRYLAREYRNTLLHGGGGRLADGMMVEWADGRHSMVTERGKFNGQLIAWLPALTRADARDALSRIDRIEEWFRSLPYYPWLEEGLPVNFSKKSVELALEHLRKGTVAEYIEHESMMFDRAVNGEF
ncbi:hypothetical protein NONI108955_22705 [Nocardia ninae]|uniref:Uncharacterized protein n=1 Tax=Nocardia ninae NBRC 108245 TaxID=1210091 RepID=A0A511MEL8_9NOCA|nr:hypothetical protein [Nocardia ninae]GEM38548.1 hypothetical protein NN4_30670 [Nocardia ninae NBRC 108245]